MTKVMQGLILLESTLVINVTISLLFISYYFNAILKDTYYKFVPANQAHEGYVQKICLY